ncbi:hypothetical protein [Arenicella xantha]|uniref:Uncharacterized protein n=1 Tax=Arenicella xantha TaxID=644221 RepID=A0A395JID1_9GAMM|nr:hypothetical protein [Arenicella xantha]RBP49349.1 hypothetical protein DFR28_104280 [Arenicella xantha]
MRVRAIQIVITLAAVAIAIVHSWFPSITVDAITVTLLGIAVIPWLGPLFKSVELPGGVKVEYQELEQAARKVEESGLITQEKNLKPMQRHEYSFQSVSGADSNLALSGLRIEIESRLKDLAKRRKIEVQGYGANNLTRTLEKVGVLDQKEAAAIRDLLPLLNQAAHGAEVDDSAFGWAMDFGPRVLGALEDRIGESTVPQLVADWKMRDGAAFQEVGTELSKAFVLSPEAFLKEMSENPTDFKDWIEGLETHTFTIYESTTDLDDQLYIAYYEKLRALMIEAAIACKSTGFSEAASKIEEALMKTEIRRIW